MLINRAHFIFTSRLMGNCLRTWYTASKETFKSFNCCGVAGD